MLYCSLIELDSLISLIILIIYGLMSLKCRQINLTDVLLFCRMFPLIFVFGFYIDLNIGDTANNSLYYTAFQGSNIATVYESSYGQVINSILNIDLLLAILSFFIIYNFQSFESVLLLLFAFIGQYYMIHSIDLLTFYISLEAQNFCFLVLCGLPLPFISNAHNSSTTLPLSAEQLCPEVSVREGKEVDGRINENVTTTMAKSNNIDNENENSDGYNMVSPTVKATCRIHVNKQSLMSGSVSKSNSTALELSHRLAYGERKYNASNYMFSVEASIKYFILSAFSSGVLLFWFSGIYIQTGMSILNFSPSEQNLYDYTDQGCNIHNNISILLILTAMLFKLGAAPMHIWVYEIYTSVSKRLILYISTAPKLSMFGYWIKNFHGYWTDYSLIIFSLFTLIFGAFAAYKNPSIRTIMCFSTINEIGLLLSALETAGFNSLFQHLCIYIISQLLLWNTNDKRFFILLAISLASLPPFAGFFGKAWIIWNIGTVGVTSVLLLALFGTAISLVYYIRIIRLFWNPKHSPIFNYDLINRSVISHQILNKFLIDNHAITTIGHNKRVYVGALCVIMLIILPIFVIKPFII